MLSPFTLQSKISYKLFQEFHWAILDSSRNMHDSRWLQWGNKPSPAEETGLRPSCNHRLTENVYCERHTSWCAAMRAFCSSEGRNFNCIMWRDKSCESSVFSIWPFMSRVHICCANVKINISLLWKFLLWPGCFHYVKSASFFSLLKKKIQHS